ncbi:MAG: hypothetical protein U0903_03505 [Planctomycetales bacterium]
MTAASSVLQQFSQSLVSRIEQVLLDAEAQTRPVEIDPFRKQLFELFAEAEATGLLAEGSEPDLSCDGIGHELSERWNLKDVAQASASQHTRIPPDKLSRMRLLWSFMRMWMEWTYAWERWGDFHSAAPSTPTNS